MCVRHVALNFGADKPSLIICIDTPENIPSGAILRTVARDLDTKPLSKGKSPVKGNSHITYTNHYLFSPSLVTKKSMREK